MEGEEITINTTKTEGTTIETTGVVGIGEAGTKGTRTTAKEAIRIIKMEGKNGTTEVPTGLRGMSSTEATRSSDTRNSTSRQSITIQTIVNTMSIVMNFSKRSFLKNQVLSTSKFTYSKVKAQNPTNLSQAIIKEMIATRNSN